MPPSSMIDFKCREKKLVYSVDSLQYYDMSHYPLNIELHHNIDSVRLIVYRGNAIFDDVIVSPRAVTRKHVELLAIGKSDEMTVAARGDVRCTCKNVARPVNLCAKGLNSYLVSAYALTLSRSHVYRKSAMNVLREFRWTHSSNSDSLDTNDVRTVLVRLRTPKKQFLDYAWSEKLMHIILERKEADEAMCWLSTMGGAFSALGEDFEHCAIMAGKISKKQFELALILDNPILVARCKLYNALSLIQRGHFAIPRYTIKKIHKYALKEKNVRLQNMCQGIWAKLQYSYKQYKQQRISASFKTLHISPRKSDA